MTQPRIVGLAGNAGAGKSTAAAFLVGRGFARLRFAAPLKSMLSALYAEAGLSAREIARRIEGDLKEKPDPLLDGRTPRHAMQALGTEWGRDMISPRLWVDVWSTRARAAILAGRSVVVEDVRFPNEVAAVRNLGGRVIYIARPGATVIAGHVSEGLDPAEADAILHNSGTLGALSRALRAAT